MRAALLLCATLAGCAGHDRLQVVDTRDGNVGFRALGARPAGAGAGSVQAYTLQAAMQKEAPDDVELAYDTAMLAERAGKYDAMEKLLRDIIARKPDFQHAYNALGYSFAERGIRLDEAETLIQKALDMEPGDPFITDSLGWVKFRRGDLAGAQALLEKAYATRQDAEIAAHLGEVLWVQGKRDRAQQIWRQALQADPDNSALKDTMKRLGVAP